MDDSSVQKLFSSCPKLERLDLIECEWDDVKAVDVSAPMLEYLQISEFTADEDTEPDCQCMISGPKLKFFHYTGELINEYCISDAPSLVHANVDAYLGEIHMKNGRQRQAAYRAHKLLRGLANVKDLNVSSRTLQVLKIAEELVACLPLFHKLNHLEVSFGPLNFACSALHKILHNLTSLESIYSATTIRLSPFNVIHGWRFDPVPSCSLTHLKTIKVESFHGYEEEVHVLKTILKSARVLERIDLGSKKKKKIHNLIFELIKECMNSNVVLG